ncbi:hypothetical protein AMTR_s00105p00025610 [Amborella trichopoda]|nr:hypothetical protein AMTR_s00105p00025610 [Amborella trichopoda]
MAPSCYGDDKEEEVSSHGSEDQLEDDLDALRRACLLSGRDASVSSDSPDKSESEEVDDLAIVRMLQQRFSLPSTMDLTKVDGAEGTEVSDDYDEDDMEILRSVQRRFGWYQLDDSMQKASVANAPENIPESQTDREGSMEDVSSSRALVPCSSGYSGETHFENLSASFIRRDPEDVNPEGISYSSSALSLKYSSFPKTARVFFEALKKNRLCQKFLRSKMIQIEALIDENRELKRRVTCLRDFQLACKRHSGRLLGQESDARVMLISLPRIVRKTKDKDGKAGMSLGPAENSHIPIFNIVRRKLPTEDRKLWSTVERESLIKGIKQQVQQCLLQNAMQVYSSEVASGDPNHLDSIIAEISNLEITPQKIRTFLPMVDWERLATMYVKGRTGAECEAR